MPLIASAKIARSILTLRRFSRNQLIVNFREKTKIDFGSLRRVD